MKEFAGKKTMGIITAGGTGTRMRPLTDFMPKELLMYGNKPFIAYCLEAMSACKTQEVKVVVGHKKGLILDYVKGGSSWELDIQYVLQGSPKGLGDAVSLGMRGNLDVDTFILMLGDNIVQPYSEIGNMVDEHHQNDALATVLITEIEDPERYGVVKIDDSGCIVDTFEKPKEEKEKETYRLPNGKFYAISGVYILDKEMEKYLKRVKPGKNGEYQLTDALKLAIETKRVRAYKLQGTRIDVGTPRDYLEEQKKFFARENMDELEKTWGI